MDVTSMMGKQVGELQRTLEFIKKSDGGTNRSSYDNDEGNAGKSACTASIKDMSLMRGDEKKIGLVLRN
ncbi:MAG: hypothetical protein ACQET6_12505 [Bacillota bacterium]